MVPEGWKWRKLGEVAELQRGFDLPKASRIEGSVPIISSGGISGYHNEHKAEAPGVVTGRYGSIGDVFFVEENFWPLNTSLWVKNFHGNHAKFIYYLLSKFEFSKFSDKTGVPGVNRNDLHAVKVGVPTQPEQKKIAQILSTWDQAIIATERLLENSQQRKKGLMQQLLTGKKRLPGFEGEWEKGSLGDIAVLDSGFSFKSNDFSGSADAVPVIRMSDFKSGGLDTRNAARVPVEAVVGLDKFALQAEDFVFGMSGSLSNYAWIKLTDLPCYLNQRVGRIRAKNEANQLFVTYLFLSDRVQQNILDKASGAAQLNISVKDLRELRITYPLKEEQNEIAHVLFIANQDIIELRARLNCLKQEKKALMQQLLTGKRRVNVNKEAA